MGNLSKFDGIKHAGKTIRFTGAQIQNFNTKIYQVGWIINPPLRVYDW